MANKNFDASGDIDAIKPHIVPHKLVHPGNGKYIGLTVNLRWFGSDPVRKVQRNITDRQLKLSQKRKTFNAEQLENASFDQLIAAIDGWEWTDNDDGKPGHFGGEQLPFTPENARRLFDKVAWIPKQLDERLASDEDFFAT